MGSGYTTVLYVLIFFAPNPQPSISTMISTSGNGFICLYPVSISSVKRLTIGE